jgi:2-oxo-3-hexenedioate decarboxylase
MHQTRTRRISEEVVALLGTGSQVVPFSKRYDGFDLGEAYDVVAQVLELRRARGETPIGRKIGFTNQAIWGALGISAPVWNFVFDSTVDDGSTPDTSYKLLNLPEPRIEPELVLHLAVAPGLGMSETDLLSCVDWVAAGFEIVYSIFPDWQFSAADAAAGYGVHGALLVGTRLCLSGEKTEIMKQLSDFSVELESDRGEIRKGRARNVLGGPLQALKYLVEEIARYSVSKPLLAGELITTGTLTEAMPAVPGVAWTASFSGIDLKPLHLRFY